MGKAAAASGAPMTRTLVLATLLNASSAAYGYNGADLSSSCAERGSTPKALACEVYVRGIIDGLSMGIRMNSAFCPPESGIQVDDARKIIEAFMRKHPGFRQQPAALSAVGALVLAFPCKPQ